MKTAGKYNGYIVGWVLAYVCAVVLTGRGITTELWGILFIGAIVGLLLVCIIGPVHFVLQLAMMWIIRRFRGESWRFATLVLNIPISVLSIVLVTKAILGPRILARPENLQTMFDSPLPHSVNVHEFHWTRGMGGEGTVWAIFSASSNDMHELLLHDGFEGPTVIATVNDELLRPAMLGPNADEFLREGPAMVYSRRKHSEKSFFCRTLLWNTKTSKAVIYEMHN